MREILFRAKAINRTGYERSDYKNGDWVYGLVEKPYNERYGFSAEMTDVHGISGIDVDHNTIGQYTGIKDRNGNMIFEGSILQNYRKSKRFVVFWNDDCAMFYLHCVTDKGYDSDFCEWWGFEFEVCGNVYDNPELMEVNHD